MISTILTHPGGAHKDDFLALCVLMAKTGAPVIRREPVPSDLSDPTIAIVDVGGEHTPQMHNFDHHHFPREHPPPCALSLVLAHYGLYENALKFCDWLEVAEWFDSRGPKRTAEWLGVERRIMSQLHSPIDTSLLRRLASHSELAAGAPLYEVMRYIGEDLLEYLESIRSQLHWTEKRVQRWALEKAGDPIGVLFLAHSDSLPESPSTSLEQYIRHAELGDEIAAIVYPDLRSGTGYGVARYEDHPRLDFTRVADRSDVHFAHTSGFVCKTSALDAEALKAIVLGAWR